MRTGRIDDDTDGVVKTLAADTIYAKGEKLRLKPHPSVFLRATLTLT